MAELVTTLRHADSLLEGLRTNLAGAGAPLPQVTVSRPSAAPQPQAPFVQPQRPEPFVQPQRPEPFVQPQRPEPFSRPQPQVEVLQPQRPPRPDLPEVAAARSWFAGKSVGVILLILGALCVLAAGIIFIAVAWQDLGLVARGLILVMITAGFGFCAQLALRRGLQASAEAMAAISYGMLLLDLAAARRTGALGLGDLATAPYEILAGVLLAAAACAGALALRRRQSWLVSLDAAVAIGMARAALGALRVSSDGYAVSTVTLVVLASGLYVLWRRLRFPVAMWSGLGLGYLAWWAAVAIGSNGAANHVGGGDVGRLAQAWPALTVALVAGLWATRLTDLRRRRVAAWMCLLPVLTNFEIIAWLSHGWVGGSVLMLGGYAVAALAYQRASSVWSPAVGGSVVVLGLSSVVGLVPDLAALATRIGLAEAGDWRGSRGLPFDLFGGDVAPWLLPLTAVVLLALWPPLSVGSDRLSLDRRHVPGVVVATLGVLPVLYGAGFWPSMAALVVVATILLCAARVWQHDCMLVLGLSLLAMVRIAAYYDELANPLAWTILAVALLGWALAERRAVVSAGFLTAAGLCALFAAAAWLKFTQTPVSLRGLVVVAIGSLGLVAAQRLRAPAPPGVVGTRTIAEGLSVTWVVAGLAGLALASSSPTHGAVELTVVGVATGITAYLSQDRRWAGWVSGVLLTAASWIALVDHDIRAVEWYTVPAASALVFYGIRRLRQHPNDSTWLCVAPGLALALTPSLLVALEDPVSWRALVVGLASVALVALGVRFSLAVPYALGVVSTVLLALREVLPDAAADWLTFAGTPVPLHGLVIVAVGSLGLVASQRLRAPAPIETVSTRLVAEGLSVAWVVAGVAMAGSSATHGAVELTVAGVATGITTYLSQDRRWAGWVSGLLLTAASWVRLLDTNVQVVEWYTVPAASALLFYGIRRRRQDPSESSWRCLGPGLVLALTPSLLLALERPVSWRGLLVGLASVALVAVGVQLRLAAPFALGAVSTALLALREIWPVAAFIPRWTLLFVIGGALLGAGMTWESRVNDARTASRYIRGLR